ncbi:hypothetical protein [Flavobacterium coralii]|uniref:hypothetical protein n=1 Tax=Flavobacterium coralii TaxID=2838017 RepID=UPI0032B15DB7
MPITLYINNYKIDIENAAISQTKQVNDIASLSDRQTNYTNRIRVPKTANNKKAFGYATIPGNLSPYPYQKNECSMYSDTGECYVYKGWAIISDAGDYYEVVIYDGIIDLYKAIENKSLSDMGLNELNHEKDVPTVVNSWTVEQKNFRYLVVDYNGKTGDTFNGEINIDYLVPSVWVPYLWQKIQSYFGVVFQGTLFDTLYFRNLYMSYPKGLSSVDSETLIYQANDNTFEDTTDNGRYLKYLSTEVYDIASDFNGVHLRMPETGKYRITVEANVFNILQYKGAIKIGINSVGVPPNQLTSSEYLIDTYNSNQDFTASKLIEVNANDTVALSFVKSPNESGNYNFYAYAPEEYSGTFINVTIHRVIPNQINFGYALEQFSVKDFVNEIVQRFALTMYKDKYTNTYLFLTPEEMIQNAEYVDWSDKFHGGHTENYTYNAYARENYFKYNYNDKEGNYNDGFIGIDNINLADKKDVVKSKLYSPERFPVQMFPNKTVSVFKLWDKEIKETEAGLETEYKTLDNRFYFMYGDYKSYPTVGLASAYNVISETLEQSATVNSIFLGSFSGLTFKDMVQLFYHPMAKILNRFSMVKAQMYLSESDVANLDFKKLYYIKQLSNYYMINKIVDYVPKRLCTVELIRVIYAGEPELITDNEAIKILSAVRSSQYEYSVNYSLSYDLSDGQVLKFETSINGNVWVDINQDTSNVSFAFVNLQGYPSNYIRITDVVNNVSSQPYPL